MKIFTITQRIEVRSEDKLVPPALTFCTTKPVDYDFDIKLYNVSVNKARCWVLSPPANDDRAIIKNNPTTSNVPDLEFITERKFTTENIENAQAPLLVNIFGPLQKDSSFDFNRDQIARCWVLSPPANDDRAIIKNNPTTSNVPDLEFITERKFTTENIENAQAPLLVNIFDPLQKDSSFDFNRFIVLSPEANRAIQFTRTISLDVNKIVKRTDVKYNIIDEYRDPTDSSPGRSINRFTFRADSFDVVYTIDVPKATIWSILSNCFTLLGVLIGSVYFPFVGHGKYRSWGFINRLVGYYPIEHIRRSYSENDKGPRNDLEQNNVPKLEERLEIYLEKFGHARYE
ncbi:2615_t:CDS:2 [Funneliformis geosporum]|uniref:2615_t:CDS:1 n=1 Tax=Funneliformis geosporum TaxID=1117311 RepID=A0A9W4SZK3_9GLOM|nr:2615_t:CDS:2 [Funneliformis geosporum]